MYEEIIVILAVVSLFVELTILYYLREEVVLYKKVHREEIKKSETPDVAQK